MQDGRNGELLRDETTNEGGEEEGGEGEEAGGLRGQ